MTANLHIVGVGIATVDVLARMFDMPTWEQGTRLSAFGIDGGGPVATALVAASRLGARVGYIGTAGNDRLGDLKMQTLRENNVDLSRMVIRDTPETQIVLVCVNEEDGERVFCGLRRFGDEQLQPDELDYEYITSAPYLHLDGGHPKATLQAAKWMREAGKTVVLDGSKTNRPVAPHFHELIKYVDVLICGEGFAANLTGCKGDIWEVGEAVLELGPRIVVQTEGADGSYTSTADERIHVPSFEVSVVDTTGCGDVFHGAYIVGMLNGWNLTEIAQFSTAVSAIKCTKLGGRAGIPTFDEALAFLAERGIHLKQGDY
ncbi:MAG TPA: carbohydrate kinase family protein [Chloroflexi bacterium]|jgi:sulfofructose kinase|nr:carbohydrate kinase family protein [Chloroflexota bacterium]